MGVVIYEGSGRHHFYFSPAAALSAEMLATGRFPKIVLQGVAEDTPPERLVCPLPGTQALLVPLPGARESALDNLARLNATGKRICGGPTVGQKEAHCSWVDSGWTYGATAGTPRWGPQWKQIPIPRNWQQCNRVKCAGWCMLVKFLSDKILSGAKHICVSQRIPS